MSNDGPKLVSIRSLIKDKEPFCRQCWKVKVQRQTFKGQVIKGFKRTSEVNKMQFPYAWIKFLVICMLYQGESNILCFSFCICYVNYTNYSETLVENKKSSISKSLADMDINDDPNEDHLASYNIQLCIQESIEASQTVFHLER